MLLGVGQGLGLGADGWTLRAFVHAQDPADSSLHDKSVKCRFTQNSPLLL